MFRRAADVVVCDRAGGSAGTRSPSDSGYTCGSCAEDKSQTPARVSENRLNQRLGASGRKVWDVNTKHKRV